MDGVKQQDSTPQNDSTLGFKWNLKKSHKILCSHISHSNRTTAFSHDQIDGIFPVLKITLL
jgi:hypothetical protein